MKSFFTIDSILIKGWKSFNDLQGIKLENLGDLNVIIGPNNIGKSNLFKLLYLLSLKYPQEKNKVWSKFDEFITISDRWSFSKETPIHCEIIIKEVYKSTYNMCTFRKLTFINYLNLNYFDVSVKFPTQEIAKKYIPKRDKLLSRDKIYFYWEKLLKE
jgi:AAA15 family ATPase/GTPase